jgi:hypothetical protein
MTEGQSNPRAPCCRAPDNNNICNPSPLYNCSKENYEFLARKFSGYKVSFKNIKTPASTWRVAARRDPFQYFEVPPFPFQREFLFEDVRFSPNRCLGSSDLKASLNSPIWDIRPPDPPFEIKRCPDSPEFRFWYQGRCTPSANIFGCSIEEWRAVYDWWESVASIYCDLENQNTFRSYRTESAPKVGYSLNDILSDTEFFIPYNSNFDRTSRDSNGDIVWIPKADCHAWGASKSFKMSKPLILRYVSPQYGDMQPFCERFETTGCVEPSVNISSNNFFEKRAMCDMINKQDILELKIYPVLQISVTRAPEGFGSPIRYTHLMSDELTVYTKIVGFHKITGLSRSDTQTEDGEILCFDSVFGTRRCYNCCFIKSDIFSFFPDPLFVCEEKEIAPSDGVKTKYFNTSPSLITEYFRLGAEVFSNDFSPLGAWTPMIKKFPDRCNSTYIPGTQWFFPAQRTLISFDIEDFEYDEIDVKKTQIKPFSTTSGSINGFSIPGQPNPFSWYEECNHFIGDFGELTKSFENGIRFKAPEGNRSTISGENVITAELVFRD